MIHNADGDLSFISRNVFVLTTYTHGIFLEGSKVLLWWVSLWPSQRPLTSRHRSDETGDSRAKKAYSKRCNAM